MVTKGLLRWIKHGDIQASLKGSDHCPIYIDLHDEITLESGEKLSLRDAMQQGTERRQPPRIAAKYWEEFSGKQTLLSTFFMKGTVAPAKDSPPPTQVSITPDTSQGDGLKDSELSKPPEQKPIRPRITASVTKRKSVEVASSSSKKAKKSTSGQPSLASFFR